MNTSDKTDGTELIRRWMPRLSGYLARKHYGRALRYLDKVIADELALLNGLEEIREQRRLAWLIRVEILLERGRVYEALAWVCLECELKPANAAAQIRKEMLRRRIALPIDGSTDDDRREAASIRWEGVAGLRDVKALLEDAVILPMLDRDTYERYGLTVPNGILLVGPPGCGKTHIANALVKQLGMTFQEVKPGDLASPYIHETQKKIGELFRRAAEESPSVILFDEIDALAPDRGLGDVHHYKAAEIDELLTQMDNCSERGILVIGTTNRPDVLDRALTRPGRIDCTVVVGPPDSEARLEALKQFVGDRPQEAINWIEVVDDTDGYSFAELKRIVDEAARSALKEGRGITTSDLIVAVVENPPSEKTDPQ